MASNVWHRCGIAVNAVVWHWCVMARDDLHFRLRIPEDLKIRVAVAAAENHRSLTAEMIARLYESFVPTRGSTNIVVRLEALPPGSELVEVSLNTFLASFDRALKDMRATPPSNVGGTIERAADSLLEPIDEFEDDQ